MLCKTAWRSSPEDERSSGSVGNDARKNAPKKEGRSRGRDVDAGDRPCGVRRAAREDMLRVDVPIRTVPEILPDDDRPTRAVRNCRGRVLSVRRCLNL